MRVLLDECLPRRLKAHLVGYQVVTVPEAGWAGKKTALPFAVVVVGARSNRLPDLVPIVPEILSALAAVQRGQVVRVGG